MAPPDAAVKGPTTKAETINLKLFIHCEGCKRKVKKILCEVEGVESVDIDAAHGKVTVIGIVDPKVLLKKLEKKGKVAEVLNASGGKGKVAEVLNGSAGKGKVAEVLNASGGKGKEQQKDQSKGDQKKPKKVRFEEAEGDRKSKGSGGDAASANSEGGKKGNNNGDNKGVSGSKGTAHTGQGEKKKKGEEDGFDELGPSNNTAHKNVTLRMIEMGSSVESADYVTHIFSDENTNGCCIM